jgi:hypothetical protein
MQYSGNVLEAHLCTFQGRQQHFKCALALADDMFEVLVCVPEANPHITTIPTHSNLTQPYLDRRLLTRAEKSPVKT